MWPYEFWWLEQQLCINNMLPSTAHRKPICLLNGQSCPQINASWGDSREWSPLQDLLYSQPSSCPLASGQQSDGWRDEEAVGQGRRWAWISGRLKDVKMEGKIRGQIDRKQEKYKKWGWCVRVKERRKAVITELFILDAEITFDPMRPQVRKKQAESLSKHMDSIYLLRMSPVHRCR